MSADCEPNRYSRFFKPQCQDNAQLMADVQSLRAALEVLAPQAGLLEHVLSPVLSKMKQFESDSDEFTNGAAQFAQEIQVAFELLMQLPALQDTVAGQEKGVAVLEARLNAVFLRLSNLEAGGSSFADQLQKLQETVEMLQSQSTAAEHRHKQVDTQSNTLTWLNDEEPNIFCSNNHRVTVWVVDREFGVVYSITLQRIKNAASASGSPTFTWDVPTRPNRPRNTTGARQPIVFKSAETLLRKLNKALHNGQLNQLVYPDPRSEETPSRHLKVVSG